jgi:hypothetical protein
MEQGSQKGGPNRGNADVEADLSLYYGLKRSIAVRSSLIVASASAILALRAPVIGLDLAFGGVCGIINMLLVMRANERLLEGRASFGGHISAAILRLFLFGAAPVFAATIGPWWGMGVYFAGFFMPLTLYVLTLQRRYRQKA